MMAGTETKSQSQIDYEADVSRKPTYHDGTPRKTWSELSAIARWSWERGSAKRRTENA